MTSGGLNNDLSENALSDFQRAHEELSVAVSRDLLVLLVFKIDGVFARHGKSVVQPKISRDCHPVAG